MSKVYTKIIQSNTEPSKNDIWLKDGQMKTFGKEGWKAVGGGVSEEDLNKLIEGGKEVYISDIENFKTAEDFNNLKKAIDSNKIIALPDGVIGKISYFSDHEIQLSFDYSTVINVAGQVSLNLILVKFLPDGTFKVEYSDPIEFSKIGDGTKFLSDDGTYKTIENNLEFFSFTDGEYIDTDVYSRLGDKIRNKIPIASYINGNCLYSIGGYSSEGLVFIFVDYAKITKVHIYRDNHVSISTYNVTSEINTLNNTITALEERIAALEGATA